MRSANANDWRQSSCNDVCVCVCVCVWWEREKKNVVCKVKSKTKREKIKQQREKREWTSPWTPVLMMRDIAYSVQNTLTYEKKKKATSPRKKKKNEFTDHSIQGGGKAGYWRTCCLWITKTPVILLRYAFNMKVMHRALALWNNKKKKKNRGIDRQ